jgi:hypothetical protein
MTDATQGLEIARHLQRQLECDVADRVFEEQPPVPDVRYAAAVVLADEDLVTLAIGHEDDGGQFILDVLRNDGNLSAAFAVTQRYSVPGSRYDTFPPEDCDLPLAQAVIRAHWLLTRPPPAPPHYCTSWRHMILHHRICELTDAKFKAFSDSAGMYYGTPWSARELIGDAIRHFEDNDLDRAERCCEAAEREIVSEGSKFQKKSPEEKMQYAHDLRAEDDDG